MSHIFSDEVVALIFSHTRLHIDMMSLMLVCKKFYYISTLESVKDMRWRKQRATCCIGRGESLAMSKNCFKIGEFLCEVCETPEALCDRDCLIFCVICSRRLGPKCSIESAPVCIKCVTECAVCNQSIRPMYDTDWTEHRGYNPASKLMVYCKTCEGVKCAPCMRSSGCYARMHQYVCLTDTFAIYRTPGYNS